VVSVSRPIRKNRTHDGYVGKVEKAVRKLVKQRFLLYEDADGYISAARANDVLR
jgi:hypothetical protein